MRAQVRFWRGRTVNPEFDKYEAELYLSSGELQKRLNQDSNIPINTTNSIQLGKVLTKMGFETTKKNGVKKYAIDKINTDDSQAEIGLKKVP